MREDRPVPDGSGRWYAGQLVDVVSLPTDSDVVTPDDPENPLVVPDLTGGQCDLAAGKFGWIDVTDRRLDEVKAYLQTWAHNPTTTQIAANGNDRLIEVTSDMVAVGGANAFDAQAIDNMLTDINAEYPTANATRTQLTANSFRFSITAPVAARDEIIGRVNAAVRDMQYARRRWRVKPASMAIAEANGWHLVGTASQVGNHLQDGLLE